MNELDEKSIQQVIEKVATEFDFQEHIVVHNSMLRKLLDAAEIVPIPKMHPWEIEVNFDE